MIFDVLTEPWMGVVDKETGEVLKVGLRDYIVNAHMYKCSAESKDFAIVRRLQQRLAEAVIIDIYGRRVNDELMSVFNNGRFDADKIDAYFDECLNDPTRLTSDGVVQGMKFNVIENCLFRNLDLINWISKISDVHDKEM